MNKLKMTVASAALVFAGCANAQSENDVDIEGSLDLSNLDIPAQLQGHPHAHFITTLKSLCETHKYILLGDIGHNDPAIVEVTANPDVLQAMKDCGGDLVLEDDLRHNQSDDVIEIAPFTDELLQKVIAVNSYLKYKGYLDSDPNILDENAGNAFLKFMSDKQQELSWSQDFFGKYSPEFGDALIKSETDLSGPQKLYLKKYLNDLYYAGQLPVPMTSATKYDAIQRGRLNCVDFESPNEIERLGHERLCYAAIIDLPLIYPDHRHALFEADHELDSVLKKSQFMPKVRFDAQLNKDVSLRPAVVRLYDLLNTEETNQIIADNIALLTKSDVVFGKYGYAHMKGLNDLDEMLGQEQTVTIMLKARTGTKTFVDPTDSVVDPPEYIYDMQNGQVIDVSLNPESYSDMIVYGMTREEYDVAVDQLPEHLKPYALPYDMYDDRVENDSLSEDWLETDEVYRFDR